MSANNWTICPKCLDNQRSDRAEKWRVAEKSYGKIPQSEYRRLMAEAEEGITLEDTLREDYELGISDDGVYRMHYRGGCDACGFEFRHEHKVEAFLPASA